MKRSLIVCLAVLAVGFGPAAKSQAQGVYVDSSKGVGGPVVPAGGDKAMVRLASPVEMGNSGTSVPVQAQFGELVRADGTKRDLATLNRVKIDGVLSVTQEAAQNLPQGRPLTQQEARRVGGSVVWSALSVQKAEAIKRASLPSPLTSRVAGSGSRLDAGTSLQAEGDVAGAVSVAEALMADQADAQPKAAKPEEKKQSEKPAMGGEKTGNNLAQLRQLPAPVATPAEVAPVTGTTADGCNLEIDRTAGMVYKTNRQSVNGVGQGACSRSGEGMKIERSWCVGQDNVDLTSRSASPTYKDYYLLDGTAQYLDATCQVDGTQIFQFQTDTTACPMQVDLVKLQASEQGEVFYLNRNGNRQKVLDCAVTTTAPAVITWTTNGCSIRHDYNANMSWQQRKPIYTWKNVVVDAATCSDDPATFYAHVVAACPDIISMTDKTAIPATKKQITTANGVVDVTACQPSTTTYPIVSDTAACAGVYYHDLAAGQSYGSERFYYLKSGVKTYVTDCQQSTKTFTHLTRTTSYVNDDTTKTAKPKTEIYFSDAGQDVIVSAAQVRAGAPDLPYTLTQANVATPDGTSSYTGCQAWRNTAVSDLYTRPDATTLTVAKGAGTPTGPVDVCVTTVVKTQQFQTGNGGISCAGGDGYSVNYYATVNKTQMKNTENGTVISTICGFANNSWTESSNQYGVCSGFVTGSWATQTLYIPPCPSGF